MAFEQSWRWYGPTDPISLTQIRQVGATGIVTALHHIPYGAVWPVDEIMKRKKMVEAAGFRWTVVESLPVHENIKKRKRNHRELISNYQQSLRNLGSCGIDTVCYNFMPILDWSRTDVDVPFRDGSRTTNFQERIVAAFDLFELQRPGTEKRYTPSEISAAQRYFDGLDAAEKEGLLRMVVLGLPGSGETLTLQELKDALKEYDDVGDADLRGNLHHFLKEVTPAAEEAGVLLAIHPDDPPRPLLGLPRIVSNAEDIAQLLGASPSLHNGLTLCTGSLGAGYTNDVAGITRRFADRIHFVHLRNVRRNPEGDFLEENHLDGDVDMYGVMKELLLEQQRRVREGIGHHRMPMRPDHGHLMLDDLGKRYYPGYSLYGRMRGLAELRGLELGILRSLQDAR
ncbi:MAG: mannonate dehydratase [Bacteroidetes bacterium]|nr:mannonate dehydratase [Bacteroidota bacterium]